MQCPKCNKGQMIERQGKYGTFFGCNKFPRCKHTMKTLEKPSFSMSPIVPQPKKQFTPNKYQAKIFDEVGKWMNGGSPRIITTACAGSGKTTTVEQAIELLPEGTQGVYYLVFNSHNQQEASQKLPSWVNVSTAHSFGFQLLKTHFDKNSIKVNSGKIDDILKDLIGYPFKSNLFYPARRLISMFKNTLLEVNEFNATQLADRYSIEYEDEDFPKIMNLVKKALNKSNSTAATFVDFDDMIYLPAKLEIKSSLIQYGFLDEVQDWNTAMVTTLLNSVAEDGKVLAVGDSFQAIYAFRGADCEAMNKVQSALEAVALPLSITYRVPLSGVELVNQKFPEIPFEAAPNAKEGSILKQEYDEFLDYAQDGDLLVCRTNAPVIGAAFDLLAENKPVKILGREFEKELTNTAKQFADASNIGEWETKLRNHTYDQVSKFEAKGKYNQANNALDKMDALLIFRRGCQNVNQVIRKIEDLYSEGRTGIRLSTVHRAKGLEANRVFLLRPDLMPLPFATQDWQQIEERNISYVAHTRHKDEFILVRGQK